MSDPTCTIEWFYDGYRSIWLYDGTNGDARFQDICYAIGLASANAESVAALTDVVERAADDAKLNVRMYPGPSHADPLANTFRVGVFTEPPVEWSPPA